MFVLKQKRINLDPSRRKVINTSGLIRFFFNVHVISLLKSTKKGHKFYCFVKEYQGCALGVSCCTCVVFSAVVLFTIHLFTI